ncbi:MAG: DUF1003 domain-containing protein, partial [Sphingomonas sp.]
FVAMRAGLTGIADYASAQSFACDASVANPPPPGGGGALVRHVGERLSDRVAAIGGSWGFIIAFSAVLIGWMLLNSDILAHFGRAFDPYPYIFLNLLLSTVAAIQAPVIMMSQNRQSAKDRLAASLDYETNLRAELDILRVHHKIDHLVLARLDAIEAKINALAGLGTDGLAKSAPDA